MKRDLTNLSKSARGFTLVELLVAITILTLIMLGVSQLMNSTVTVTLNSFKHMDADTQARMVLDRIAFDVSRMVQRSDVDYYFNTLNDSDQMAFYSESSGYYPVAAGTPNPRSSVSLVGYRINSSYQLERLSKGLVWNGYGSGNLPMVFLPQTINGTWNASNGLTTSPNGDQDYQIIGDQIFRMELSYLVQTASGAVRLTTIPNTPIAPRTTPYGISDIGYFNPQQVQAIIVTIGVLDSNSQKLLGGNQVALLKAAAQELVITPDNPPTSYLTSPPLTTWETKYSGSGDYLGLKNKTANSQVRFYQRYCYLNHVLQP